MDFIVKLPESIDFDTVMIIVNLVSKRTNFILIYMIVTTEGAIRLFLHDVWKLHNLPTCIVLNKGLQFIACFIKELYCLLGIESASSMAWYIQLDR